MLSKCMLDILNIMHINRTCIQKLHRVWGSLFTGPVVVVGSMWKELGQLRLFNREDTGISMKHSVYYSVINLLYSVLTLKKKRNLNTHTPKKKILGHNGTETPFLTSTCEMWRTANLYIKRLLSYFIVCLAYGINLYLTVSHMPCSPVPPSRSLLYISWAVFVNSSRNS